MHHGVTFNFGSAKVCSPAMFETSFSYDKDIWIAATRDEVKDIKYLYLKYLNTFFQTISNTLSKKVFVFKYITKVSEVSNTFSNTF